MASYADTAPNAEPTDSQEPFKTPGIVPPSGSCSWTWTQRTFPAASSRCKRSGAVVIRYGGGHRYPHLEPIDGARRRLDEILAPAAGTGK